MQEGAVLSSRAYILAVLEERFGKAQAAEFKTAVNALEDEAHLDRLHRLAVRCDDLDEIREALASFQRAARRRPARRRR